MTTRTPAKPPAKGRIKLKSEKAQDRLAQALRENLKRRKAQERARETDAPPKKDR